MLADGVGGKAEPYGLFNLGEKGKGYFSFVFRANEAETESITIPAGTLFPSQAMTNLYTVNSNPVYIMYETQSDVTFYKQANGTWAKPLVEKETTVESAFVKGEADNFTFIKLGTHDYPTELDNWNGGAIKVKDFLATTNFYSHVLIDGVELGSTNEALLNVWGNKGVIAFRTSNGANTSKITIKAGCQFPTYNALMNSEREAYVVKEDITFVKNANGEWVVGSNDIAAYIAEQSAVLDAYKAGEFYEAEEAKRAEIIATAKANMANLLVESDVNAVVNAAKASIDMLFTKDEIYVTQDVAMIGRTAGWHGNGNFEIRITLGDFDYTGAEVKKAFEGGELRTLLTKLDFFNHIKLGEKTLAEWGCTACYENGYWLNNGGPQYTIMIPLSMSKDNMTAASAAGVKADYPITIMEGALIPSSGYLSKTSDVVYRAGADYVTSMSSKAYGIEATAKTTVESLKYVQDYKDGAGYFGISFVGDDYLGDGSQLEINQDYYFDGKFVDSVLVNGEAGKVKYYGLFNLGEAGKGYYAFQILVPNEELVSITIPAGAKFPTRAMTDLQKVNGNPVYIMYEVEESIKLYNSSNGFVSYAKYVEEQITNYKTGLFREAEETQRAAIVARAVESLNGLTDNTEIDAVFAQAKASIDLLKTDAQYKAEELAAVKTTANAEVEGYKADVVYLAEQAQARTDAINAAKAKIEEAITEDAINAAVAEAKAAIDALETKETIVSAAIVEVDAYKADEVYLEAQAAEKAAAVATAKEAIASATTKAAIDTAVSDMKAAIDQIKTKAQIEAEALAAKKATANETIDSLKRAIDFDLYEEDAILTINTLYATAKAAIDSAETEADVDAAVAAFEAALNEVPLKSTDNGGNGTDNNQTGEVNSGCFGTVSGLSMGVLLLGFVSTVLLKKKED
jgi:hypothetical protein